ncbi:unnamed protein product [Camellia sinensis]
MPPLVPVIISVSSSGIKISLPKFNSSAGWLGKTESNLLLSFKRLGFSMLMLLHSVSSANLNLNQPAMCYYFAHFLGLSGPICCSGGSFNG